MILDRIPPHEWRDLAIAWVGTSLAFVPILNRMENTGLPAAFVLSLVTVGIAFVIHECAHKFVAMREGFWAEFKRNDAMIALSIILGWATGIVIAAPGAAVIYADSKRNPAFYSMMGGYQGMTSGEMGRSAAAGPVSNIILCVAFLALSPLGGFIGLVGAVGASINAWFALFNMIPFGPLDGKKVLSWSKMYYLIIVAAAVALFVATIGLM